MRNTPSSIAKNPTTCCKISPLGIILLFLLLVLLFPSFLLHLKQRAFPLFIDLWTGYKHHLPILSCWYFISFLIYWLSVKFIPFCFVLWAVLMSNGFVRLFYYLSVIYMLLSCALSGAPLPYPFQFQIAVFQCEVTFFSIWGLGNFR